MRWADVDLTEGIWSKPPSSTKQKKHHEVPLSAPARALLARIRERQSTRNVRSVEFVFPSPRQEAAIWSRSRRPGGRCARPLTSTACASTICGILRQPACRRRVAAADRRPAGPQHPATTARYAHLFADPMRAAAEKIGMLIENAAQGSPPDNVVTLKAR